MIEQEWLDDSDITSQADFKELDIPNMKNSGSKFDAGKPRYSLMPFMAEMETVNVLGFGAEKYGDNNWKMVENLDDRYYSAMQRHLRAYMSGEINDSESNLHHLAHAACCVLFMLENSLETNNEPN